MYKNWGTPWKIHSHLGDKRSSQNMWVQHIYLPCPYVMFLKVFTISFPLLGVLWFQLKFGIVPRMSVWGTTAKAALPYSHILSGNVKSFSHPSKCVVSKFKAPALKCVELEGCFILFSLQRPSSKKTKFTVSLYLQELLNKCLSIFLHFIMLAGGVKRNCACVPLTPLSDCNPDHVT